MPIYSIIYPMNMFFTFIMVVMFTILMTLGDQSIMLSISIINSSHHSLDLSIFVDMMAVLFIMTVTLISISVFNFSFSYMNSTVDFNRFHILLLMFVISMLILILSNNMFTILIGWDGLGITSYLLVIYYGNNKACNSGMITVMTNRFGDIMMFFSLGLLFMMGITPILFTDELINTSLVFMLALVMAGMTKSAQMPFSAWLPAAMAAPTPVSSLVHSSTLVTAGVYLLIRHFHMVETFSLMIYLTGLITMTTASFTAMIESDMKKMVALSTLSQLGIMFMAIGLSWSDMAFMHLIIHAFFKAMMFISTGNLIHFSGGYQAINMSGGLLWSSPLNSSGIMVASFSLMGAPFAAAFYSKEPMMEMSLINLESSFIGLVTWLGVVFTIVYSARFLVLTMSVINKSESLNHVSEESPLDFIGMMILFVPAFSGGAMMSFMYLDYPAMVAYSSVYKLFIMSAFVSSLGILFIHTPMWESKVVPMYSFMSLAGLNIISSKMWTSISFFLSSSLNSCNFDYNYKLVSLYIHSKSNFNYGLNSASNLLYMIVPLIFFLLIL